MKYSILMGLPGSGKSTWAENYRVSKVKREYYCYSSNTVKVLNCDLFFENDRLRKTYGAFENFIYGELMDVSRTDIEEIIIDGLFTTNDDINKIISTLDDLLREGDSITIHHWEYDKDQCKKNDLYRRNKSSNADIDSLPYDTLPDIKKIRKHISESHPDIEHINIYTEHHDVYKKPTWCIFADKYGISYNKENGTFKSNEWATGGRWGDCWGNEGAVSPEEPVEFTEFDKLLEQIDPNISFLKYKAIKHASVSLEEECESGYYGSYTNYNFYLCNLKDLYNILEEFGMINEEDILNVE